MEYNFTRSYSRLTAVLLILAVFAMAVPVVMAQSTTTGDITGTITDPSGAVVSGADVTLKSATEGTTTKTTTNQTGAYRFPLLKPGEYKLTISQKGFKSVSQTVPVALGQVVTANMTLELGSESETVEVTGAAPLIQTENANLSTTMSAKMVDLLPNSGNDLTAVAYTAPGVQLSTASGGGYGNFTAFGLPATANLFTVNGNDEMDPYLNLNNSGATNLLLGKNEIDETAVVSNGYTGQYGRQAGAQVDYATKSGSNSFHGNAMYWWNGRTMNANDWFANQAGVARPFVNNNQYAARFGGPIKKDKAFFFVDYEGLRLINATSSEVIVPSTNFLQAVVNNVQAGGFTNATGFVFPADPAAVSFYQNFLNLNANAPGIGGAAPLTAAVDPSLGCGDLSPQSTGPLAGYGLTKPCAVNLRSVVGQPSTEWILTGRTDFNLTNNDKLFLRYRMDRGLQPTTTDAISPLFNAVSNQPQYEGQLTYTRTISPTTVNNFIASGSWYSAIFDIVNRAQALQAFPYALIENTGASWYAGGGSGLFGPSSAFPQGRKVTQYQFTDDLSMTRGVHEFKTGVNFRRNDITDGLFGRRAAEPQVYIDGGRTHDPSNTDPNCTPRCPFSGMDLFVNGLTGRVRQYFPQQLEQPMAIYSFGAYFQDVMRVKSDLKLTLTLRADRNSNLVCQTDCIARLSGPFSQLNHDPSVPFNQMFQLHKSLFPNIEKVSFQPRLGFAWNPGGKSNTVIRGGVGLFTDLYPATLADSFALNSPTSNRFTFRPPNPMPISPADTSNPLGQPVGAQIANCNSIFNSVFAAGGTLADYQSQASAAFGTVCSTPDYNSILQNTVPNPKYVEWNVEVQQSFGTKSVLSVNYVGNRGYDLFAFNPFVNAYASAFGTFPGLPTDPPDSRVNNVSELTNNGESNYNGVTVSFTRRLTKGFSGTINYTYSHALDDISNGGVSPFSLNDSQDYQFNPAGLRVGNYGNADYDVRHNLSANYVWDLPFKSSSGVLNQIIGGWTISGTFYARTGYPFTVTDGLYELFFGNALGLAGTSTGGLPAQWNGTGPTSCGKPKVNPADNTIVPCLSDANQFPLDFNLANGTPGPIPSGFSTTRRNFFRGPNFFDTDLNILKRFKVTERASFAVGANFYNILNHPNFANPNNDVGGVFNGPFGQVTSTAVPATSIYGAFVGSSVSGRVVQLHARVEF
jgi:Carboxypeptidase regulatory-like domain